jgi:hypothetical protein
MRYLISDDEILEWIKLLEIRDENSIIYIIQELENIRKYPAKEEN